MGLVASMDASNVAPNLVIYNTLLHGAVTAGDLALARRLKLQVAERELGCNEMHLIGLLRLAGRERRAEDIAPIWTFAIDQLYRPDEEAGRPPEGGERPSGGRVGAGSGGGAGCSPAAIAALAVALAQCRHAARAMHALQVGLNMDSYERCVEAREGASGVERGERERDKRRGGNLLCMDSSVL